MMDDGPKFPLIVQKPFIASTAKAALIYISQSEKLLAGSSLAFGFLITQIGTFQSLKGEIWLALALVLMLVSSLLGFLNLSHKSPIEFCETLLDQLIAGDTDFSRYRELKKVMDSQSPRVFKWEQDRVLGVIKKINSDEFLMLSTLTNFLKDRTVIVFKLQFLTIVASASLIIYKLAVSI